MTEGGSYAISPAQSLSACGLLSLLGDSIFSFQKRLWARSTNIFKVIPRSLTLVKSRPGKGCLCPAPRPAPGQDRPGCSFQPRLFCCRTCRHSASPAVPLDPQSSTAAWSLCMYSFHSPFWNSGTPRQPSQPRLDIPLPKSHPDSPSGFGWLSLWFHNPAHTPRIVPQPAVCRDCLCTVPAPAHTLGLPG